MLEKNRTATVDALANSPQYMPGFGNDFETESLPGALPQGQNSPQKCNYGLYAEQLSGSPFTAPRGTNERSWLYRIRPSVRHTRRFSNASYPFWKSAPCLDDHSLPLGQLRWNPIPDPAEKLNFLSGIRTMTAAGDVMTQVGMAAHAYVFNDDMIDDYFFNADGELLVVPQLRHHPRIYRDGHHGRGAVGDLPRSARHDVQGLPPWRRLRMARLYLRELWRQVHPAGSRPDRRQLPWPTHATSRPRSQPTKTRKHPAACM